LDEGSSSRCGSVAGAGAVVGDNDNEQALLVPALVVMTCPIALMAYPKLLYDVGMSTFMGSGRGNLQGFSPKLSEGGSSLNTGDER
jgi:hypothetical protein